MVKTLISEAEDKHHSLLITMWHNILPPVDSVVEWVSVALKRLGNEGHRERRGEGPCPYQTKQNNRIPCIMIA